MDTIKPLLKARITPLLNAILAFFLLMVLMAAQRSFAADINVSVDRNPVSLDESFQIIFTATQAPDDDPDFSPLEQDFSILSQGNSSSSSWINGQASKTIQWTLKVMAKQMGNLLIPAIKFGDDSSLPNHVEVIGSAAKKTIGTDEELFIEVEATPENPVIQSQVFYTLRLYTKVEIAQAQLNEPELADAVIEKLGDDSSYNTTINGVAYSVTERKYAIFPQKSGLLTIKPLVLSAEVLSSGRPSFNGFFNSQMSKTKRVESKAITLNVKPAPANFTGRHWLTAQQLVLKQEWSGDMGSMKVGEPLTRTISLLAKGTTVGQLPELTTVSTNAQLKTYPDQPVLQEQKKIDGLLAFREEKCALLASKAGSYTLPAIEIPWFNTETQKMAIARIPETTLTATAVAGSQLEPTAPTLATATPPTSVPYAVSTQAETSGWLWASLFLASGWLMTVLVFLSRRTVKKPVLEANAAAISLQACVKGLKNACVRNDAEAAKVALLAWGRQQFNATNLNAVAVFCEARLRDEILCLNRALYGKEIAQWQGKRLLQTFTEHNALAKITATKDNSLEPLYRL